MQLAMMEAANRDRVFVADFPPQRAGLSEAKVMRFGRRTAANDARLLCDEFAMFLVPQANGLRRKRAPARACFCRNGRRLRWGFRVGAALLRLGRRLNGSLECAVRWIFKEGRELDLERRFDESAVRRCQGVLVGKSPIDPVRRVVG